MCIFQHNVLSSEVVYLARAKVDSAVSSARNDILLELASNLQKGGLLRIKI